MREFDGLPSEVRNWMASAQLPWSPRSVRRAYHKALSRTGDSDEAIRTLDEMQSRLVAKDVKRVWGADHPAASP